MSQSNNEAKHYDNGIITTTLTNPGIIDRLEEDIADYLSPFGFCLERQLEEDLTDCSGSRAVLVTPRLPYSYIASLEDEHAITANNNGALHQHSVSAASSRHAATSMPTASTTPKARINDHTDTSIVGPLGTLHLHIYQESLLSTVGPLLRTYLRLSPHHISPLRLRSVIYCHFTLDALAKYDKMNSEQKDNRLKRQEELSAKRMAHHVHMLVRNSMGSALCLELVVVLPCYWRRKIVQVEMDDDTKTTTTARSKVPISVDSMISAMRDNPDACNPSVQLVEQIIAENEVDGDDRCYDDVCNSTALHLDVRTRMCTVRHQPLLFRWVSSLQYPIANCNGSASLYNEKPYQHIETHSKMPIIVACIEKVGNLHRILMLCHDYDKIHCHNSKGGSIQNEHEQSMLSSAIVILPNITSDQEAKTLREFDNAIDHFHKVIIDPEKDSGDGHSHGYRPTLVYEEHAAEKISIMIEQCQYRSNQAPSPVQSSIVGIDLHPDALTLHGDYATTSQNKTVSPALQKMRDADAIVFGYESTGIPETITTQLLNSWVQIPSRSSINVVAAMSIVLDALMAARVGSCTNST